MKFCQVCFKRLKCFSPMYKKTENQNPPAHMITKKVELTHVSVVLTVKLSVRMKLPAYI